MYSRATTSEMADRPFFGLVVVAFGVVEGFSFGIVMAVSLVSNYSLTRYASAERRVGSWGV